MKLNKFEFLLFAEKKLFRCVDFEKFLALLKQKIEGGGDIVVHFTLKMQSNTNLKLLDN